MNQKIFPSYLISFALLACAPALAANDRIFDLEPLPVNGDLLNRPSDRLPSSLSIMGTSALATTHSGHFADTIGYFPNLNWAGGTSRPRYFQIRGIGENSQFGNEIPASSVGFMIDGIDFTGIGTVASLFDINKIEVLRGPQAAAFGANAMAGMVLLETTPATGTASTIIEGSYGDNDLISFGAGNGGSLHDGNLAYRISVNHHTDNGFRNNSFLDRNDTNGRNEWSSQIKLNWAPASDISMSMNVMYFDFDNGYDAWALDNDSFNTSTDEPGQDLQSTLAVGMGATWNASDAVDVHYKTSVTDTEMLYSYDWDWSNPDELRQWYGEEVYWGTDVTDRTRDVWSHDLRLVSSEHDSASIDWATGIYYRDFQEEQSYFGIDSVYTTGTAAIYGQIQLPLSESLALTLAGRIENHAIDFSSRNPWAEPTGAAVLGGDEDLWGGKIALEYSPWEQSLLYLSIDRGYKAGGVNLDDEVPMALRVYGSEKLINYELGWKAFLDDRTLWVTASAFLMDRQDIQVDSSVQLGDGNTFALYKDNAASGRNYGVEIEMNWQASEFLRIFASIGLLETEFDDYQYVDPADSTRIIDLGGRDQAYAPTYTYAVGLDLEGEGPLFAGVLLEGKDAYIFDTLSGEQLDAYNLLKLHVGYRFSEWTCTLWMKNALDETYDVRGFYFANEPPYYDTPRNWLSQGDPRQIGVTVRSTF